MFEEIKKYAPQRMFVVGGMEDALEQLRTEIPATVLVEAKTISRFTVDDAAEFVRYMKEGNGQERIYLCYFSIFSPDAAEAMLKVLEEPDLTTTVIFSTPRPRLLPQTILSRVHVLRAIHEVKNTDTEKVDTQETELPFPKNLSAALDYIKKEFDSDDDAATLRARATQLLDALEIAHQKSSEKIKHIYHAKHLLFDGNLPAKQVLEYVVAMVL